MKHEQYKTSLFQGKATGVVGQIIRSYDHELYSEKVRKMVLCPSDHKRYVKNDLNYDASSWQYSIWKIRHPAFAIIQQLTANMSTSLELRQTKATDAVFAFAKLSSLEPEWELQVQHIRQLWNAVGSLIDRNEFYSMFSSECAELALPY